MTELKFKKLTEEFINTGGGCMVLVTSYFDVDNNRTIYTAANEEGCTISTVNTILINDIDAIIGDKWDEINIESCDWVDSSQTALWRGSVYNKLFNDAWYNYTIEYCKKYQVTIGFDPEGLPTALQEAAGTNYIKWAIDAESRILIDANGLVADPIYRTFKIEDTARESTKELVDGLHTFKAYVVDCYPDIVPLETEDEYHKRFEHFLDDYKFVISFGNRSISIPNYAAAYDAVVELIQTVIDEVLL